MKNAASDTDKILVEYSELGQLLYSHRDSIVYRIRLFAKNALGSLSGGEYNSHQFLNRISSEIKKSRELFSGLNGKNSGKDICEFIEEKFPFKEVKNLFDKMEKNILLSADDFQKKSLALTGYIEIVADEIFSKLVQELREIES